MKHAALIDGKRIAQQLKEKVAVRVKELQAKGVTPGLTVVIVGEDPASQVYVRNKVAQTRDLGMVSEEIRLPAEVTEEALLAEVKRLNADPKVHGILVQLPLPGHIREAAVIQAIAPEKDVDGFHIQNVGNLVTGAPGLVPCTPLGCLYMLQSLGINLAGLHAVVIGRSNIVGKPMAHLLLQQDCTVTIVHSRTRDLPGVVHQADIVIAAVGKPRLVKANWVKPGAIVIDVGINRIEKPDGGTRIVGDVDFDDVVHVASAITPVPGGVGPMTIACLLANTVTAAAAIHQLELPPLAL